MESGVSRDQAMRMNQVLFQYYCPFQIIFNIVLIPSSTRLLHQRSPCEDRHRRASRSRRRSRASSPTTSTRSARTCRQLASRLQPRPPLREVTSIMRLPRSSASVDSTRKKPTILIKQAWAVVERFELNFPTRKKGGV